MPTRRLTGSRIREKRLDQGMKQAALAAAVGISPSYLNLIEHNRRRIGGKLLGDLARALGVDAAMLTEGADSDLLDQMRAAAALTGEIAEVARAEELAARYPGWSALIAAQSRRLSVLEQRVQTLTDRMTHDPQLAAALHEMISSVTAIRSSASILVGGERLDEDWQRRFHENIHNDSRRLADNSEALIAYLEAPGAETEVAVSPFEQRESFLSRSGFHLAELETDGPDIAEFVAEAGLSGSARQLLHTHCTRYVQDARALPMADFEPLCRANGYDPAAIAQARGVSMATVLRRLATLPADAGHPPMGLAICDSSGAMTFVRKVAGFGLPRSGGSCPLWPVFSAFSRPSQPVRAVVALPGTRHMRFLCYAVAEPVAMQGFDAPPLLESTMLIVPDPPEQAVPPQPVGVTCRICPRTACTARREPAMPGLVPLPS